MMRHSEEQRHTKEQNEQDRILAIILWSLLNHREMLSDSDGVHLTSAQIAIYLQRAIELDYFKYGTDGAMTVTPKGEEFVRKRLGRTGKWPRGQKKFKRDPITSKEIVFPKYYNELKAASEH